MKNNIVLIGFMGSGKTTVGRELAKEMQMEFIDTDAEIEKDEGMAIKDMFAKFGEKYFRDLETKKSQQTEEMENKIISTGGGIVLRDENVEFLGKNGFVVLLETSPDVIYERVKGKSDRPLLNVPDPMSEIKKLLEMRKDKYNNAAHLIINTDKKSIYEITEIIKDEYLKS